MHIFLIFGVIPPQFNADRVPIVDDGGEVLPVGVRFNVKRTKGSFTISNRFWSLED